MRSELLETLRGAEAASSVLSCSRCPASSPRFLSDSSAAKASLITISTQITAESNLDVLLDLRKACSFDVSQSDHKGYV